MLRVRLALVLLGSLLGALLSAPTVARAEGELGPHCFVKKLGQIAARFDPERRISEAPYRKFMDYTETGYQNIRSLSGDQRQVIAEIDRNLTTAVTAEDLGILRQQILDTPLSNSEKDELIRLLGLNNTMGTAALEDYRKNLQYFFWSDHSHIHMQEILARSKELQKNAPKEFLEYFEPILNQKEWSEKIESAIRIHDSRMSANRAQHAELLLEWDDALFQKNWTAEQKALNSVLGMLHSKSTVPYAMLADWPKVVAREMIPTLVLRSQLSPAKAKILLAAIAKLTPQEVAEISKAAAWIRIADAARPVGAQLRNSLGYPIRIRPNELDVFVQSPAGEFPVPPSQFVVNYGQAAMDNLVFGKTAEGALTLDFPLRLQGAVREKVLKELADFDPILRPNRFVTENPQAMAIARMIQSIVSDFPPELASKLKFRLK